MIDSALLPELAAHFPLAARPRPACPSLPLRVDELTQRAARARTAPDSAKAASEVLALAARIADDCSLDSVSHALYRRQIEIYSRCPSLTIETATLLLEVVFSLARLRMRRRGGITAWRQIESAHKAVCDGTDLAVDGLILPLRVVVGPLDALKDLRGWTQTVMLSDGVDALVLNGSWSQALATLEKHKAVAKTLVEGRQVAIIARCLDGSVRSATRLLESSLVTRESEQLIVDCLRTFCHLADQIPATRAADAMLESYIAMDHGVAYNYFQTRCGIAVVDLAAHVSATLAERAHKHLVDRAIASEDAFCARAVLATSGHSIRILESRWAGLASIAEAGGLGMRSNLLVFTHEFSTAVETAVSVLNEALRGQPVNM